LDETNPVVMKYATLVAMVRASGVSTVDYIPYFKSLKDIYPAESLKPEANDSVKYFNENNGYGAELAYMIEVSQDRLTKLNFDF
jgi:hypothetical protein